MQAKSKPLLTALICTADRPASAVRAVASLLSSAYPNFEVIVVDQTKDGSTAAALTDLRSDSRLRYLRSEPAGKGTALSLGLAQARGAIVACTDDDCVVPPDWLMGIAEPFAEHPKVAVVFGGVEAAPHDSSAGFVPAYRPVRDRLRSSVIGRAPDGMGACMAVRKAMIDAIGGFDPAIGPGGLFRSGDDRDIAIRTLLAGFSVYETTSVSVVHHGFRSFRDGREHARRAWYGMGAMCAKPLKRGRFDILFAAADLFILRAVGPMVADVIRFRRPQGMTRALSFVSGFLRGLGTPLRRDSLVFDVRRQSRSVNMMEPATHHATVTALVCTAGRPEMVVRSIASILTNIHPPFELFVIDQSTDRRTAEALEPLLADPRVHYVPNRERGKGAALNAGLAAARTEIIACTDDDCEVPTDWLDRMAAAFEGRPNVAVVFGAVSPKAHDPSLGYVPSYEPPEDRLVTSIRQKASARGIGACMGLRRSAITVLGGFDPAFGPGGPFGAGEDWDIAARALLAGYAVFETPSVRLVHDGFRTFKEGRSHARRDWYGIGAVCAKPLRAGHLSALAVALEVFLFDAVWPPASDLLHLRRPLGITRILAFVAGFGRGLRTPVRHDALIFDRHPDS